VTRQAFARRAEENNNRKSAMKNLSSVVTVVVSVAAIASLMWTRPAPPEAAVAQAMPARTIVPNRSMHTTGTAVIRVQPDKATVRLGVQTFGVTPRASQARNAEIVEQVLQAIHAEGVSAQDIATDYFAIRPEQDFKPRGELSSAGYWTDNAVIVTLREVDKLSDVLTAALEAGATTVDDVTFSTTRLRELRDQARTMAVNAALEKARNLAGAADLSVGDVLTLDENSWSSYYGTWNSRGQWANLQQNVTQVAAPTGASSIASQPDDGEFSLGQIVVQAQVELTVAIR
jgi:uncharacterized protein YggE